jgi:hypothetical protein
MNFEDLKKSWQCQAAFPKVTLNADASLKEVRRNQKQFSAIIFSRDVCIAGITFLLIPIFLYSGIRTHEQWSYYMLPLACLLVGVFIVVDRLMRRRKQPAAKETFKSCAEGLLAEVSHEIWLSKNVVWWCVLPITAPIEINVFRDMLHSPDRLAIDAGSAVFSVLVGWGTYYLSKSSVRKDLEPRRQELEKLLSSLNQ